MKHNKKKKAGMAERLALLSIYEPRTEELLTRILEHEPRRNVATDDILDAVVAFVTSRAPKSRIRSVRGIPASDESGLPMEMLYVEP